MLTLTINADSFSSKPKESKDTNAERRGDKQPQKYSLANRGDSQPTAEVRYKIRKTGEHE